MMETVTYYYLLFLQELHNPYFRVYLLLCLTAGAFLAAYQLSRASKRKSNGRNN